MTTSKLIRASLLMAMVWGMVGACGSKEEKEKGKPSPPQDDSSAWVATPVKAGDAIVAKDPKGLAQLRPGKALTVKGGTISVKFDQSGYEVELPADQVHRMPSGRSTLRVKAGDVVLFKADGPYWLEGIVEKIVGKETGSVLTTWGRSYILNPNGTIVLGEAQAQGVRRRAEGGRIKAEATKLYPVARPGYQPKKGERVIGIVVVANSWEPGEAYGDSRNQITWDDPKVSSHPSASRPTRVAPIPPVDAAPPLQPKTFVLVKNPDPKQLPWVYGQVTAVTGTKAQVITEAGVEITVGPGEYAILK